MNIASMPLGPAASARVTVLPVTTSRSVKSGAWLPRATIDEGVRAMIESSAASVVLVAMLAIVVRVFPDLFLVDAGVGLADRLHRQAPAGGRVHGEAGNQLFEIGGAALGACRHISGADHRLKLVLAGAAGVLENRHTPRL